MSLGLPKARVYGGGSTNLPPTPTRREVCMIGMRCFNGTYMNSGQYGADFPLFPPVLGWFNNAQDRQTLYDTAYGLGDTHVNLTLKGAYPFGEYGKRGVTGYDFTFDMPRLRALIIEAICAGRDRGLATGFKVLLMLSGDGHAGDQDPSTLGREWLMANFGWVDDWLAGKYDRGPDVRPWIAYCLGYDGVVPNWQPPSSVDDCITILRAKNPTGHFGIELSGGYCVYAGDEFNNWKTPTGKMFDFILIETSYPPLATGFSDPPQPPPPPPGDMTHWDQVYQVVGRLVDPYIRPPEQPAWDDPNPPFLLEGTPRGDMFVSIFEYDTYGTTRMLDPAVSVARRNKLLTLTTDPRVTVC